MFLTKRDINGSGQPGLWERMNRAKDNMSPFSSTHNRGSNREAVEGCVRRPADTGHPSKSSIFLLRWLKLFKHTDARKHHHCSMERKWLQGFHARCFAC